MKTELEIFRQKTDEFQITEGFDPMTDEEFDDLDEDGLVSKVIIPCMQEYADQFKPKWISVEDEPLINEEADGRYFTTEAGSGRFMAAVPYTDSNKPGEELWWIHDCVFDNGGLCVVCEDSNEPAGWNIEDVTHYYPVLDPPLPTKP